MRSRVIISVLVLILALSFSTVLADVPRMINYQGKLTKPSGALVDTTVAMTFAIYQDSSGGTPLWTETHSSVVVEYGVFSVLLGEVTPIPDTAFDGALRYLGIIVGGDSEMTPRKEIVSVAYAYKSRIADYASIGAPDDDWTFRVTDGGDTTLTTSGWWGIARAGNVLYGNVDSTHVNLGVACTTGVDSPVLNYKYCTVGGGAYNAARKDWATIGGGTYNIAGSGGTIAGGSHNSADAGGFVGGGTENSANAVRAVVAGGTGNNAGWWHATIGGGFENTAIGERSTIGGGSNNSAIATHSTISGGSDNFSSGWRSTVSGGAYDSVSGSNATVGGGSFHTVSGDYSTVPGGLRNSVESDFSFAAGDSVTISSGATNTFAFGRSFSTSTPNAVIFYNSFNPMKLGIQTTAPDEELHVVGNIKMVDGNQGAGKVLTSDANGVGSWQDAAVGGSGWTDDGNAVRLETSTDSVGIGTATPSEKLEVSGNIKASGTITSGSSIIIDGATDKITATSGTISFDNENLQTTGNVAMGGFTMATGAGIGKVLTSDVFGNGTWNVIVGLPSGTSGQTLRHDGANWVANSLLYNNGTSVGIGTTSPNEQLEITGNLRLPATTATVGIIKVGANRFIHNYGTGNTFVGENAGNLSMTSLGDNTATGYQALYSNTTGYYNTATGYQALYSNTTGYNNTANGNWALYHNTTGNLNTAVGQWALFYDTTKSNNTAVGASAGDYKTATNSTFLGANASANASGYDNSMCLGYDSRITASNQVRVGNSSVTSIGGQVGWTTLSDGRYKKITSENVPGLSFINKLRPVTYTLDMDAIDAVLNPPRQLHEGQSPEDLNPSAEELASRRARAQIIYTGFIGQEVEQASRELGYVFSGVDTPKNDKDMYGLRYAEFVVPLVKAVQEQQQLIEEQQQMIQDLQKRIEELEKR